MVDRMLKVNELVRQHLAEIINEVVELPVGVIMTIIAVVVSKDLKYAKVLISVIPLDKQRDVLGLLIRRKNILQAELGRRIVLRQIPRLQFALDDKEEKAAELDYLLDHLK